MLAISLGFSQISTPLRRILPSVGLLSPFKRLTSVDLPDPVPPIIPMISPLTVLESHSFTSNKLKPEYAYFYKRKKRCIYYARDIYNIIVKI